MEDYSAEKGVWSTITNGAGPRGNVPLTAMDSKGILWIMFGMNYRIASYMDQPFLFNVWNYNPKTDQYRYVWGNSSTASNDPVVQNPRQAGTLGVPDENNHPGGIAYSGMTVDKYDNLWLYSYEYNGELWMFNTTSWMFMRVFGQHPSNTLPSKGAIPGQAGEDVWPGQYEGHCLVADTQNNLWLLGGYNYYGISNSVWHFNTTSLNWNFIYGSTFPITRTHNATFYGGTELAGCFMDENDRVWLFGGWGQSASGTGDYGSLWTFDTSGTRQYELEYGPDTFKARSVSVSADFHADNHPGASQGSLLVDRMDGTLLLVPGTTFNDNGTAGASDQVWVYSKSLKQWKLGYGSINVLETNGTYVNYRQPGSKYPCTTSFAATNSRNFNGDTYIVGGYLSTPAHIPSRKDIWFIPGDQCSSPAANKCDVNAVCVEEMFGYSCRCNPGFSGDGFTCTTGPVAIPVDTPIADAPGSVATPSAGNTPSRKTSSASFVGTTIIALISVFTL